MSTFTKEQLSDDRLVKILSETQAEVTEHNSRCARGSVEVDARMFESMLVEIQLRRHLMEQQAAMLQGADGNSPVIPDGWVSCSERMPKFGDYLVTDGKDFDVQMFNGEQFIPGFVWEDNITHWMPLPAAPQQRG